MLQNLVYVRGFTVQFLLKSETQDILQFDFYGVNNLWISTIQGQCQGKLLEGAEIPQGCGGSAPWQVSKGRAPRSLDGGQGAKPPEADALLAFKLQKPSQSMHFLVKDERKSTINNSYT